MTIKYVPNIPMIEAAARFYGGLAVEEIVEKIEAEAIATAPVETGAYQASIQSEFDGIHGRVFSDIRYAVYLEFGTSDTPTFATLGHAAEVAKL